MSIIVSTKLTVDDYVTLRKLCEEKGCSTYRLLQDAVQEYLMAQDKPETCPEPAENIEVEPIAGPPESSEPVEIEPEEVSDKVMRILRRRPE